ncbi:hypothetical protein DICSQDRAFT_144016 [Dichomitus squalens LYAD-421 SS1]|uniref:uncharacterized protein n=1 Tax=Dichomitus squalens (strain LYAD-421) TaxID=732165 RepID=UPI000441311A|nr:uncharacterized protein DICSQDRAFT_144016 [Dichomitus squalens LYAD-421 SS1]EJF65360.1 hypothetical protein DICSQDRAFT_144016 [Dichomitus squalens LYAD-421 SS1]
MTRGRRKDMTIPPSRALLQQRDYRARKAQYVADLEVRVKKAEDENVLLRKEIDALQAKLKAATPLQAQSPYGPEVAAASSDLMHHLTVAAASITRFQQLAFYPGPAGTGPAPHVNRTPITLATPTYTPSPVAPPHAHKLSVSPRIELPPLALSPPHHRHRSAERERELERERQYREPLPSVYPHRSLPATVMGPAPGQQAARFPAPSDPDCCEGYVDCRGLVQEDDESMDEDEDSRSGSRARFTQRMSDVRSTTSSSSGPEDSGSSHTAGSR